MSRTQVRVTISCAFELEKQKNRFTMRGLAGDAGGDLRRFAQAVFAVDREFEAASRRTGEEGARGGVRVPGDVGRWSLIANVARL